MSMEKGWIPIKEDSNLQIKHRQTKPVIIPQVDENMFRLEYSENETFQVGKDGASQGSWKVPPGKKFDVRVHVIITDA